jgi:hypothetical protein
MLLDDLDGHQALTEIHRIMLEDSCTKEAFRQADGFLAIINTVLSLSLPRSSLIVEPEEQVAKEVCEGVRLVFVILSEAMDDDSENSAYFEVWKI